MVNDKVYVDIDEFVADKTAEDLEEAVKMLKIIIDDKKRSEK